MHKKFSKALAKVLKHEGGFVDHPADPGGATNKGVTQKTYDRYLRDRNTASRSVRDITDFEVEEIYRLYYWNRIKGDDLPSGLDYCVFDTSVLFGPGRAARFLQLSVGVSADGVIGPITLAAAEDSEVPSVVDDICDKRLAYLRTRKHWPVFGRGWTNRINDLRRDAKEMYHASVSSDAPCPRCGRV